MAIRKLIAVLCTLFFVFNLSVAQDKSVDDSATQKTDDKIYNSVDEMPYLESADCDELEESEKKACRDNAFIEYFYKHIIYPPRARENGIQGIVVISFVIEKDGSATDIQVLKDIGGGCGQAAKDVIDNLEENQQKFVPGKQDGDIKRVKFVFPVKFRSM